MNESIACVIIEGATVFIAKRLPTGEMGGRWEFPGGKCEAGETPPQTITREFMEEFGCDVRVGAFIAETRFSHRGQESRLLAYRVYPKKSSDQFVFTEHSDCAWVRLPEVKERPFVDSDLLLYDAIASYMEQESGQ
jgi:8-oxo-dGTP diphosphatase